MLTIHHLGRSQSERILWLCEELGVPYALVHYERDPVTRLAPPEYRALHPMGAAPVITDGELVLGESAAIMEYILARHGGGRLVLAPDHPGFAQYLYWFHFANGSLMPIFLRSMTLRRLELGPEHPMVQAVAGRQERALGMVEARLAEAEHLAGPFTAADIITVFAFTTLRYFLPFDLGPYPAVRAWLQRIGGRDAYRRAMQKGDPDMPLLLT